MSTINRAARVSKRFLAAAFALYYYILIPLHAATILVGQAVSPVTSGAEALLPCGAAFSSCGPDFIGSSRLQAGLFRTGLSSLKR
jgi:hypothetical protein